MANLEHYKTFLKVAELGSMTKAAEELYVSQPAVTQTIRNIENDLGGPLFLRNNRVLELTAEGRMLYEKVKAAVSLIGSAESEFGEYNELKKGELRIGISTMLTKIVLMDKIVEFKKTYPGIKVTIENGITLNSLNMMQRGLLDLCVFNSECADKNNTGFIVKKLDSLKYCFIYNPEYFACKTAADFLKLPFIIQKEKSGVRDSIDAFFRENKNTPNIAVEAVSNELIISMVEKGLGVGCVYEKLADMNQNIEKISATAIKESDIYIASHGEEMLTSATKAFVEMLKY